MDGDGRGNGGRVHEDVGGEFFDDQQNYQLPMRNHAGRQRQDTAPGKFCAYIKIEPLTTHQSCLEKIMDRLWQDLARTEICHPRN